MEEEMEEEELEAGIESVDSLSRYHVISSVLYMWGNCAKLGTLYIWIFHVTVKNMLLVLRFQFFILMINLIVHSTPTGVETPDVIDLRKQQRKEADRPADRPLYTVSSYLGFITFLRQ